MTMADEADAPNPEQPTPTVADTAIPDSPGRQLRQAREARKLDIPHVATALRLTPGVVDAIERDDYAPLPSATFVSGYIRGYARLVGLDPEPLNQSFRRLHPDAEPPPRHGARGDQPGAQSEDGGSGGPLIVLAVAAGGYAWWVMRPGPDEQARPASTPESAAPQPASTMESRRDRAPDPAAGNDPLSARDRARSTLSESPAGAVDADSGTDSEIGSETGSETGPDPILGTSPDVRIAEPAAEPPALDAANPTPNSPAADRAPSAGTSAALNTPLPLPPSPEVERPAPRTTATPVDEEEEATATPPGTTATAQAVELSFSGPCWVDIRDATGEVLLFGEMSRGDRETLAGEPPYSLVIGNAAAVELSVGGAPYDLRSVARGNVARFELDPAEIGAQTPNSSPNSTTDATPSASD